MALVTTATVSFCRAAVAAPGSCSFHTSMTSKGCASRCWDSGKGRGSNCSKTGVAVVISASYVGLLNFAMPNYTADHANEKRDADASRHIRALARVLLCQLNHYSNQANALTAAARRLLWRAALFL